MKRNKEDNTVLVIQRAVRYFNIPITKISIKEALRSHSNYPTFRSICDFFEEIKVQNYALRYNESDLNDLNYPLIAHLKESEGKVIMVYSLNKEEVVYADSLIRSQ